MIERLPVDSSEFLYRRGWSTPLKNYLNPNGTATSRVFKLRDKDNGELSVDVKSKTTFVDSLGDDTKFILFEILNRNVLAIEDAQLITYHDPLPTGLNDAHAVIVGMEMDDEITPGLLARQSRRVLEFT